MKCFPAMVIFFIITAMASWFGCDTQQKDLDGKSIPHVTQVKDSTNEQSGNWIPPRGMPDGMPVPSVEPTRYYHDQSEYKIANVEYQKRLLELGRRQPKTDNEIHIMMKRCRKTLDELGYQPNTVGIKSGSVLICGLFLPPPYRLSCELEKGAKSNRYKLLVNGITLYSSLPYDDCGWPYEVLETPLMQPSGCEKKVLEVSRKIDSEIGNFSVNTTNKEFLSSVKKWKKMFLNIRCDKPGELFEISNVHVSVDTQEAWFYLKYKNSEDSDPISIPRQFANTHDPRWQARYSKHYPEMELAKHSLELCMAYKSNVENFLSKGLLVTTSYTEQPISLPPKAEILSIKRDTSKSLIEKIKELYKLLLKSPECLLTENR